MCSGSRLELNLAASIPAYRPSALGYRLSAIGYRLSAIGQGATMSATRREFLKTAGAAGIVIAGSDLIGDLLAQTPPGRVLDSKFKGLSDIALKEAKTLGCSYADIRFTRSTGSGANATGGNPIPGAEDSGNFGGGGRGGRGGGGFGGGGFGGRGGGGG